GRALGQLPGVDPVLGAELRDAPHCVRHDHSPPPRRGGRAASRAPVKRDDVPSRGVFVVDGPLSRPRLTWLEPLPFLHYRIPTGPASETPAQPARIGGRIAHSSAPSSTTPPWPSPFPPRSGGKKSQWGKRVVTCSWMGGVRSGIRLGLPHEWRAL